MNKTKGTVTLRYTFSKTVSALLLALLVLLSAIGCGANAQKQEAAAAPAATATQAPTSAPTAAHTPAPTPAPTVVDFRFTQPEDFAADPENPMRLLSPKYPRDPSFIGVSMMARDESVLDYTKESYAEHLSATYAEAFGKPVQITVDSFRIKEIDGSPGMRVTYFLDTGDLFLFVLEITAVADQNYQVGFADGTNNNAWMNAFSLSSRTIDIVWSDEADGPDYSTLPLNDPGVGLTIRMAPEMTLTKNNSFDMFYTSEHCLMTAVREGFDVLAASGAGDADTTLEEYIGIVERINGVTFETDAYGNPFATYVSEIDGKNFTYYFTVRKGSDAFWLVNFACPESEQGTWLPQFALWANSIRVK